MKLWQGCLIAFVAVLLFVGAVVGVVFYATSGMTDKADEFFAATNEGDYEAAHALTSQRLQQTESPQGLEAFITRYGLGDVADTSWSNRSMENDTGELTGTITTGSGGTIPLTILFVSENDEWMIDGFDIKSAGLSASGAGISRETSSEPMEVPSPKEQEDLVWDVSNALYQSLGDPDFSKLHSRWVPQMSLDALDQNFAGFREYRSDLQGLTLSEPEFEPATALNDDGFLEISGRYELPSGEFRFLYIFTGEGSNPPKLVEMDAKLN